MDPYTPGDRRTGRTPPRQQTAKPYHSTRHRSYRTPIMIGATAALVAVVAVATYFGVRAMTASSGGSGSQQPQASAVATTTAPLAGSATAATASVDSAARAADASGSATASGTAKGSSSATTAWRDADPAWMKPLLGKYIDGFTPQPGYKAVALTFDDGPNGETQYVIDTLSKYGGQATFFDTGRKLLKSWAKAQPSLIYKAGFELGNHTQHHTLPDGISSMWHRSYATDLAEINGPDAIIKADGGGIPTVWLRPMGGMIDATGIKAAVATNHLVINWTIDSNDSHGGTKTPDYLYNAVTSNIKSGDVVLMHVTHPESMAALPRIAAALNERGFKMVTLSELAQHSTGVITQRIPK